MLYVSSGLGSEFGEPLSLPLLSVGQRKSQGQLTFKEWINKLHLWREELEAHITKFVDTGKDEELEDFCNPYNIPAQRITQPS